MPSNAPVGVSYSGDAIEESFIREAGVPLLARVNHFLKVSELEEDKTYAELRMQLLQYANRRDRKAVSDVVHSLESSSEAKTDRHLMVLGLCYSHGTGRKEDLTKAVTCLTSLSSNNSHGNYELASAYQQDSAPFAKSLSTSYFNESVGQKSSEALRKRGDDLRLGRGPESQIDLGKAEQFTEQAAKQENPLALNSLGLIYYQQRKFPQAKECFEKAASRGCAPALENLAILYFEGKHVPQDLVKASRYMKLRSSVEPKPDPAQYNLTNLPVDARMERRSYARVLVAISADPAKYAFSTDDLVDLPPSGSNGSVSGAYEGLAPPGGLDFARDSTANSSSGPSGSIPTLAP